MSAPLKTRATRAPDPVEFLINWLLPTPGDTGPDRPAGGTVFPYKMVTLVAGSDPDKITMLATLQVDTFHPDDLACQTAAWDHHYRILAAGPPGNGQAAVALSGGKTGRCDKVWCSQLPTELYYSNTIRRYFGRYRLELRHVAALAT